MAKKQTLKERREVTTRVVLTPLPAPSSFVFARPTLPLFTHPYPQIFPRPQPHPQPQPCARAGGEGGERQGQVGGAEEARDEAREPAREAANHVAATQKNKDDFEGTTRGRCTFASTDACTCVHVHARTHGRTRRAYTTRTYFCTLGAFATDPPTHQPIHPRRRRRPRGEARRPRRSRR